MQRQLQTRFLYVSLCFSWLHVHLFICNLEVACFVSLIHNGTVLCNVANMDTTPLKVS